MNDKRPENSIGVLRHIVRVPPICAPLIGDCEIIGKALPRGNRTLCNANCAVHPNTISLEHTMPMYRGTLTVR
jgi:hypothetical protein